MRQLQFDAFTWQSFQSTELLQYLARTGGIRLSFFPHFFRFMTPVCMRTATIPTKITNTTPQIIKVIARLSEIVTVYVIRMLLNPGF